METPLLVLVALACGLASVMWGRSARHRLRVWDRISRRSDDPEAAILARGEYRKDLHTTALYGVLAVAALFGVVGGFSGLVTGLILLGLPVIVTLFLGRGFDQQARATLNRTELERRAQEVLSQEQLAPVRWAARLAPAELPEFEGYEVGRVYQAGTGLMAGDFYDAFQVSEHRVAVVIGDVTGHGIEPSITAFQAKYLLRVFLRQFRDPAQALEQLNAQMSAIERGEEFISLVVIVFDSEAETIRYVSAGHPAAFFWHQRETRPLRATGPVLMLDPESTYLSREFPLASNDLAVLYTDGLAEARDGDTFFGEERIAHVIKRDPGVLPDVICKQLLEAATDFSDGPISDDVAILAIRRL
ncbi:MAG: serine/threonine-protein phosphatase [Actinomycetia bacterium]|nr:serine/threonine-protein phosphatase [Actinomycetes bacterium]